MGTITHYKFSDIVPEKKNLELHVIDCGDIKRELKHQDSSRSDFFSVGILAKGEVNMKLNLTDKTAGKNSLLFLAPSTIKQIIRKSNDAEIYSVLFTSKFLLQIGIQKHEFEMLDFLSSNNDRIVTLTDAEVSSLLKLIKDLKEKNEHISEHPFGEDIVQYTFRIFLSELAAIGMKYTIVPKVMPTRKQDLVIRFGNLVNMYFKEHRTVKYYAEQLAITPKYLTEVVHEYTGKPAGELIDEKVIQEAKILLNDPRLSIAQIAEALHFSDQSFLGKFFKRHLGVSPSQYRSTHLPTSI
jgi:AraC-like DNA-binding protein